VCSSDLAKVIVRELSTVAVERSDDSAICSGSAAGDLDDSFTVTVASGFQHTAETLASIAQTLKKKCGSGGTAKDGEIEIQGDHTARVGEALRKMGYRVK
jgi:formylmethanofuran dehydrogenase subunit C